MNLFAQPNLVCCRIPPSLSAQEARKTFKVIHSDLVKHPFSLAPAHLPFVFILAVCSCSPICFLSIFSKLKDLLSRFLLPKNRADSLFVEIILRDVKVSFLANKTFFPSTV